MNGKLPYKELKGEGSAKAQADEAWEYVCSRSSSVIKDIFTGQSQSTLQCPHCAATSYKFEEFVHLSLPLPQKPNLKSVCTMQVKKPVVPELKQKHMNV